MNVAETRLCLLLHSLPGLSDNALATLLGQCGGPTAVVEAGASVWRELGLLPGAVNELARALRTGRGGQGVDIDVQQQALNSVAATVLPLSDPLYPPLLRAIHDPPPLLYVRGDPAALLQPQLAIVGSRRASSAGLRASASLAAEASRAGLHITSGLAQGIDGASHRGALAAGGSTVAVVATGIEQVYPTRHRGLAGELEQAGCLVSEFPPGMPPLRQNFPRRNRIISGLALGVLVVEAAIPSGSLITARTALEQGREVFALPWSVYHCGGAGCLRLLRDGAKMVETIGDVLEELGPLYSLQQDLFPAAADTGITDQGPLSASQQSLLQLLGYEAVSADELVQASAQPVTLVMSDLSELELLGHINRSAGGYIRS